MSGEGIDELPAGFTMSGKGLGILRGHVLSAHQCDVETLLPPFCLNSSLR